MAGVIQRGEDALFRHAWLTLGLVALVTLAFATRIPGLRMFSEFPDLLPQDHPYVALYNDIRDQFGGANVITVALVVEDGTILTNDTLARLERLTEKIDTLPGVNHNLVSSLTHRTVRRSWIDDGGSIRSDPYYDPNAPALTSEQLDRLAAYIQADPAVYGLLVSPDLKAAIVKAQLNEFGLDYAETFSKLQRVRQEETVPGIRLYATGQPVLIGWTYHYLPEITQIFLITVAIMLALLIYYFRRFYGVLLPILSTLLSGVWGLGFLGIMGYNVDPLTLVVPFLVSARALSHSVQMVERYYEETRQGHNGATAARNAFDSLSRPGLLAVISDAVGIWLIALGSIPLNDKMANYCAFWALSISVTVLVVVPLLLSRLPTGAPPNAQSGLRRILPPLAGFVTAPRGARWVLGTSGLVLGLGFYFSSWVVIGENEPGSPILYPDHDYNVSSSEINRRFPGSEDLYIIATTGAEGGIKRPEVLRAIRDFQNHMLLDPEIGGSKAITDVVMKLNSLVHSQDPRWAQIPDSESYVGGLMFAYMATNAIPNALKEYITPEENAANVAFFLKDHQGVTIKRTLDRVKEWMASDAATVEDFSLRLAGGVIGVTAAINEEVWDSNNKVLPAVLAFVFFSVLLFYRSLHAGILMFITMTFATVLTHAFMGIQGIGMNINTIPVIAIGIGVGIDYAIYIMDRVKEKMAETGDVQQAAYQAMCTTGLAITFTATTLVMGVAVWIVASSMRFQADAATLLVLMMLVNMVAAMMFVPAWMVTFRPRFLEQSCPA